MNYRRMTRLGVALAMFIVMAVPVSVLASENERTPAAEPTPALFEGDLIDMSSDWDGAGACMVWPEAVDTPECFRTEAEMDKRIAELERQLPQAEADIRQTLGSATMGVTYCSSSVRLYDGTSYTGAVLYLRGRQVWYNLVDSGFNQKTSSFKIGACSAYFADLAGGTGDWYPTSQTQAYDVATSMASGWDNDVSSVWIT
ncbi:MAG: hypothetical protein QNL12_03790 [Acidimicrobiia bacterium]|nr:hypothetical protein [Acidimicrobiia bacterium]MDX2466412.1 hypothetical protein [Acidimicrobiia bacterium]